jgi:hypothetical protein
MAINLRAKTKPKDEEEPIEEKSKEKSMRSSLDIMTKSYPQSDEFLNEFKKLVGYIGEMKDINSLYPSVLVHQPLSPTEIDAKLRKLYGIPNSLEYVDLKNKIKELLEKSKIDPSHAHFILRFYKDRKTFDNYDYISKTFKLE